MFWFSDGIIAWPGIQVSPETNVGWIPAVLENTLSVARLSWHPSERGVELCGVASGGVLRWCRLMLDETTTTLVVLANHSAVCDGGYRAAALVGPGHIAGVTASGIHWLRPAGKYLTAYATTAVSLPEPVAAFPSPLTGEVLIVCQDGSLERVTVPS